MEWLVLVAVGIWLVYLMDIYRLILLFIFCRKFEKHISEPLPVEPKEREATVKMMDILEDVMYPVRGLGVGYFGFLVVLSFFLTVPSIIVVLYERAVRKDFSLGSIRFSVYDFLIYNFLKCRG